eukprot:TRINITY_DN5051_c0_g1_i6.p1 TRINITY_DN5051_c0_g1~~TRINITY_DN5051_c0_g1_i6.p1  ORF type:complete len:502 (+),score=75.14 TRINITY_DN5051_c0_g1_i6:60-1565(+)
MSRHASPLPPTPQMRMRPPPAALLALPPRGHSPSRQLSPQLPPQLSPQSRHTSGQWAPPTHTMPSHKDQPHTQAHTQAQAQRRPSSPSIPCSSTPPTSSIPCSSTSSIPCSSTPSSSYSSFISSSSSSSSSSCTGVSPAPLSQPSKPVRPPSIRPLPITRPWMSEPLRVSPPQPPPHLPFSPSPDASPSASPREFSLHSPFSLSSANLHQQLQTQQLQTQQLHTQQLQTQQLQTQQLQTQHQPSRNHATANHAQPICFTLGQTGAVRKKPSNRPSSGCFSYRLVTPSQAQIVFQSLHVNSSSSANATDDTSYGLCKYIEQSPSKLSGLETILVLGNPNPITGIFLSYTLPPSSKLVLADLPGLTRTNGPNCKLNACPDGPTIELCEFPWDEEDYMGKHAADVVLFSTSSFLNDSESVEHSAIEICSYIRKLASQNNKIIMSHHHRNRQLLGNIQRNVGADYIIAEDVEKNDDLTKDVQIFHIQKRLLPRIGSQSQLRGLGL